MSYGRFASIGIASAAGILGGYYTFKPELDEIQKEKELKEQSNAAPESRYVVEKPVDKPAVKADRSLLAAATEGEEEGRP